MESTLLTQIFDFYALRKPRFGCTWIAEGSLWKVLPSAIYMEITKEGNTPVSSYKNLPVLEKLKEAPHQAYPENRFIELVSLSDVPFDDFVSVDKKVISIDGKAVFDIPVSMSSRHCRMLCGMIKTYWNKFETKALCCDKASKVPVLRLTTKNEALWVVYAKEDSPEELKIETEEVVYKFDCWNDVDKCYEKVRKENKMNLNVNTSKLVNDILGVAPNELKVDPSKAGKEIKVEAEKTIEVSQASVNKASEEPVKEPLVEAPAEVTVKRTRKKADTTPVTDLTKVIDQLSGAVPEGLSAEEAQQAIRQLRDLMQKAASRMANISLKYIEGTEGAVAKLAAIKAAL